MNKLINHHVCDHQVGPEKKAAIMIICPKGLNLHVENQITALIRMSINFGCSCHNEDSLISFNVWNLRKNEVLPAIASIPRHFKQNHSCLLHVIFVCHGENGCLIWNRNTRIHTMDVLQALEDLNFGQLDSVAILGCESLKGLNMPKFSYSVLGFNSYFFWNEFPIFVARYIKEYFAGEELSEAVKQAIKSCSVSNITKFPEDSFVFFASNKQ